MLAGLQQVTFEFGARLIVADATWHIQPGERIGLIGYNGTGKSTLLKLFVGDFQPSAGSVERSRDTSIGYLHQDLLSFNTADSILKVALQAFSSILKLEEEIEQCKLSSTHTIVFAYHSWFEGGKGLNSAQGMSSTSSDSTSSTSSLLSKSNKAPANRVEVIPFIT